MSPGVSPDPSAPKPDSRTLRYSDLEIALRRSGNTYTAGLRFNGPDDAAEQRPATADPVFTVDLPALQGIFDPLAYGKKLGEGFFQGDLLEQFNAFRNEATTLSSSLRVRISIESSAQDLHAVHWETLPDPLMPDAWLFMGSTTIVSRFLASGIDSKPVRLSQESELSALIVVANPADLIEEYELAKVKVTDELANVQSVFEQSGIRKRVTPLAPGGPVSLQSIEDELAKGEGYDILYLVCHGALIKNQPNIFLEEKKPVLGAELVRRIWELDQRPRLIVLASCQSAGKGGVGLAALGPQLANAGVPAVIAMQGNFSMDTSAVFMKEFFTQLVRDGQIDRAASMARGAVRDKPDCWMPALFMRLRNGRIWYNPGFKDAKGNEDNGQWKFICESVRSGQCVPIVGPDVAEHITGNSRAISSEIARKENFPLDTRDQFDLAKVSQYLATKGDLVSARATVRQAFTDEIYKSGARILNRPVDKLAMPALQQALASNAATLDGDSSKRDPLRIVAGFDARVFVNAGYDTLLEAYVREAEFEGNKKEPIALTTQWDPVKVPEFMGDATVQKPFVYYVFGNRRKADDSTWVLTEDNFFDYLIRATGYKLMPGVVGEALADGSLLFLGFPLDDWKFRVLFRMIFSQEGGKQRSKYKHVAVQVDPAETTLANARMAKEYLRQYFTPMDINIYWGTAADFLRQLQSQLEAMPVDRSE